MELNRDTIKKLRWLVVFTVVVMVAGVNYRKLLGLLGSLFHIASPFVLGEMCIRDRLLYRQPGQRVRGLHPPSRGAGQGAGDVRHGPVPDRDRPGLEPATVSGFFLRVRKS